MFTPFSGHRFGGQSLDRKVGFEHPPHRRRAMARRTMPLPELVATLALVICTLLTMTVVSIEIAQAASFSFGAEGETSPLALAGILALLLAAMGGLAAAASRASRHN